MTSQPPSHPSVDPLELLGLLSARLAHALSNQLSIVTGNLCAASATRHDPEKLSSALKSALQSADAAGTLLSRFVEMRRSLRAEVGRAPVSELIARLESWTASHPGWSFAWDAKLPEGSVLALGPSWFLFILEAIDTETHATGGLVRFSTAPRRPRWTASPDPFRGEEIQVCVETVSPVLIDWEVARREFASLSLVAAYELFSHLGTVPQSQSVDPHRAETRFTVPLADDSFPESA